MKQISILFLVLVIMAFELAHSLVPKRHQKALAKPNDAPREPAHPAIDVANNGFGDNNYLHIGNVVNLGKCNQSMNEQWL